MKHAQATRVDVQQFGHDKEINLTIEDNGKGFSPSEKKDGLGLNQMKIRTESLGEASYKSNTSCLMSAFFNSFIIVFKDVSTIYLKSN